MAETVAEIEEGNIKMSQPPLVIKIGGSTLGSQDTTLENLVHLQKQGKALAVVHGGGKLITQWLSQKGASTRFVRGQRVTDAPTLEVVVAVLAGIVNKEIVSAINSRGGRAVGLSGVDGHLLEARIKDADLGLVGEVVRVHLKLLQDLLQAGYIPVIAPIGWQPDGQLLNINADIAAGDIAAALHAERLVFLTDVIGVCDGSGGLLSRLSAAQARELIASGTASGGMIPKIEACLRALSAVPLARIIDGRTPHALLKDLESPGAGTTIVP